MDRLKSLVQSMGSIGIVASIPRAFQKKIKLTSSGGEVGTTDAEDSCFVLIASAQL